MRNHVVNTNEFSFWYGDFQALRSLTFNISAFKITALIGPSGCGKSTFLKCLNRINERGNVVSHEGSIQVFGQDIYHPTVALPELRKQVGMVFQKPNPLPLSIYENVIFGARTHIKKIKASELDDMVESSLKRVGLWDDLKDQLNRSALTLSLEKQQRLCIARLLPLKPKLLLLDEPCSALDPAGIEAIETLIKDLKKDYSIIIVTHSMSQAKRVSDETIFMYMGELVEMGQTEALFNTPKEAKTAAYIEGRFG
ncbi:phosphate ABC transporter ATP-binding protein [Peredibacter starrii]|uniref:Phosphate ABC transporter ATP-binding protein n=1 Tax=Peredibacter starrii TaxID=28202 RepID=A0AAX4HTN1_9BACT|nr:phosphate ABC transporter ATP-binding protein [Peredibacter starrii]WPU66300.1 phosphate ABC transporter ATP-binding protein [Peredibacter starrii]